MKAIFPVAFLVAVAGLSTLFYSSQARAAFPCELAYQQCVRDGEPVDSCFEKLTYCHIHNNWPEGVTGAIKDN